MVDVERMCGLLVKAKLGSILCSASESLGKSLGASVYHLEIMILPFPIPFVYLDSPCLKSLQSLTRCLYSTKQNGAWSWLGPVGPTLIQIINNTFPCGKLVFQVARDHEFGGLRLFPSTVTHWIFQVPLESTWSLCSQWQFLSLFFSCIFGLEIGFMLLLNKSKPTSRLFLNRVNWIRHREH